MNTAEQSKNILLQCVHILYYSDDFVKQMVVIMVATNFNIRLDSNLRDKAFPVFERYGLSAAQAFKLFLNQVAETETIPLSFDYAKRNTLTPKAISKLNKSIQEVKSDNHTEYEADEEAMQVILELAKCVEKEK